MTAGTDGRAVLWDVETGLVLRLFEGHTKSIFSVTFSPNGEYVLTVSSDETARLWAISTGEEIHRFEGEPVTSVAFSPNGKYVVIGDGGRGMG